MNIFKRIYELVAPSNVAMKMKRKPWHEIHKSKVIKVRKLLSKVEGWEKDGWAELRLRRTANAPYYESLSPANYRRMREHWRLYMDFILFLEIHYKNMELEQIDSFIQVAAENANFIRSFKDVKPLVKLEDYVNDKDLMMKDGSLLSDQVFCFLLVDKDELYKTLKQHTQPL